ncbi:unnamed protein product, partial [Prorocentrum cordatum]
MNAVDPRTPRNGLPKRAFAALTPKLSFPPTMGMPFQSWKSSSTAVTMKTRAANKACAPRDTLPGAAWYASATKSTACHPARAQMHGRPGCGTAAASPGDGAAPAGAGLAAAAAALSTGLAAELALAHAKDPPTAADPTRRRAQRGRAAGGRSGPIWAAWSAVVQGGGAPRSRVGPRARHGCGTGRGGQREAKNDTGMSSRTSAW